jgi:2-dehydro-3-deoxyglucarate aldolase
VREIKTRLCGGETCFGTWISSGNANALDILKGLNFDWFVFDMEHSPITIETVNRMLQVIDGAEAVPLVRVGQHDQALVKIVLDSGSRGIVFPLVNTREEAERVVQLASYPPRGIRGVAAGRVTGYGADYARYIRNANDENLVVAQIETKAALENLDEILGVGGIDVAFVGPSDLTMQLGFLDDRTNPKVIEAMLRVVRSCQEHGKTPGIMTASIQEAKSAVERGFRFISLASDVKFLTLGAKEFLKSVGRE